MTRQPKGLTQAILNLESEFIMYTDVNFKTKKAFKEAVAAGKQIRLYSPAGIFPPKENGREFVEGPRFPQPHTWYAQVEMEQGIVVKVK